MELLGKTLMAKDGASKFASLCGWWIQKEKPSLGIEENLRIC